MSHSFFSDSYAELAAKTVRGRPNYVPPHQRNNYNADENIRFGYQTPVEIKWGSENTIAATKKGLIYTTKLRNSGVKSTRRLWRCTDPTTVSMRLTLYKITASIFTFSNSIFQNLPLSLFLGLSKAMFFLVLRMILGLLIRKLVMNHNQNTSQLGYLSVHNDVEASEIIEQQQEVFDIESEITVQQQTVHNDVSETIEQQQEVYDIES
ncbi:hypothetical protein L2E82_28080 [Cichorium intybus]|uniref:Uncharacterized protein n=1 Tax=Cichorium intybus TaxID=13427 RepID=A0ACB9CUV0_CICIN|nr:hypothetical protein L2E82_28080 [Cichorium intybus]